MTNAGPDIFDFPGQNLQAYPELFDQLCTNAKVGGSKTKARRFASGAFPSRARPSRNASESRGPRSSLRNALRGTIDSPLPSDEIAREMMPAIIEHAVLHLRSTDVRRCAETTQL